MPCVWEAILPTLHICRPSVCVFPSRNCSIWALMDPAEPALEGWTGKEKRGLAHITAPQTIVSYSSSSSPKGILNNWQCYLRKHKRLKRNRGEAWL